MMSFTSFCFSQLVRIKATRVFPIPGTSSNRSMSFSITSKVSRPKCETMSLANFGPMPLTRPLPRYFSMPTMVAGSSSSHDWAANCLP